MHPLRQYFDSGATRSHEARRQLLLRLRQLITEHETEISQALYTDLKKSPEEAYGTEIGLVLAEISHCLKNLKKWMRPRRLPTNLLNWPSSSILYRDPLGVVLVIAPWNYPFQLALLPLMTALAAGNTVVLKPSELAPATSAVLEKMLKGIDAVRVVTGEGAVVVPELIRGFHFDHIFFTGSAAVGRSIYQLAAERLIPVTLELGGKSPVIVESDADVSTAARRIIMGKFINAGQTCIAPDYLLVHAEIKDRLIERMKDSIRLFYGDERVDLAKIINEKRWETLVNYLGQGKIICGGEHDRDRLYIAPTLIEMTTTGTSLMKEEIFGPLLPVVSYRTMEEALAVIRQNPSPLAFYLFTRDRQKQKDWMKAVPFGGGCINNTDWHFTNPNLPFGGVGASGFGAYHGKSGFDTFTHAKGVMRTPRWPDLDIKYPPFKGKMKWFKLFMR